MAERGPVYAFDTQSEMSNEAGRACFEIIREELEAAGSPLPDPITLIGVLEQWMPEGSVLRFSGMARFAAEHGTRDATGVRGCTHLEGAIGLDARTVQLFRTFAEDSEARAQLVTSVKVDSFNIMQLDQVITMGPERPDEAWAGFWEEVQMLLRAGGGLEGPRAETRKEAARPVLAYMAELSDGRQPFDEAALQKLRDGAQSVIEAEVLAERRMHAVAEQRPLGLVVHHDGVVLVQAPWFENRDPGYDSFRVNRCLPPEALQALEAASSAARG